MKNKDIALVLKQRSSSRAKFLAVVSLLIISFSAFTLHYKTTDRLANVKRKPNIIVITVDNLGYADFSSYGNKVVKTTHVDALAKEGTRFTNAYSTSRNCSPSRAATLTGRYQQKIGHEFLTGRDNYWFNYDAPIEEQKAELEKVHVIINDKVNLAEYRKIKQGLPLDELTLAELLKSNGYKTAHIGKWHLGETEEFSPLHQGFDYTFGFRNGGSLHAYFDDTSITSYADPVHIAVHRWVGSRENGSAIYRNEEKVIVKDYLSFKFAEEANHFIEENKENPFFLYLPFHSPHYPYQAPNEYVAKYASEKDSAKRIYYAMLDALDDAIGRVTAKVKELGLEDNTVIFLASDNGGTDIANNGPLRGNMSAHFEGGVRVPFFIKYPGVIPAGKIYDKQASLLDIFATSAALAGAILPADRTIDGVNLLPYITNANKGIPHNILYWRNGKETRGIRKGDFKLVIVNDSKWLFDLSKDIGEKNNLVKTNPAKVKELLSELETWEKTLHEPLWPSLVSSVWTLEGVTHYSPI